MDPTTPESPPGCLVILIPLSTGMAADVPVRLAHRATPEGEPDIRELPGEFAARFLADELLDGLVNSLAAGYPIPLEVAVLGYGADDGGNLTLVSLLPGAAPEGRFLPLADLAKITVDPRTQEGDPRKWIAPRACEGPAPAGLALAEVYRLVSVWLTGRFSAKPPVVIHCTAGEGLDEAYARVARSLGLLVTVYGPARLLHYGFAVGFEPVLSGMWPGPLPEPWAALEDYSAELPAEAEGRPARRAVSVNDWTIVDAWSALFDVVPVETVPPWATVEPGRFAPVVRELWTQKMGNKPEEWEDSYASDPTAGVMVIADGASSGIYCRSWADQLTKRFIQDRPDARDPLAFGKWVHALRGEWRTSINYSTLNWAKQRKVDEVGAAATLLGLEVGPADESGNRPWRATAVGDASLFWVRDGQLRASFPVVASDQFGSAPLLVRSNPGFKTLALIAEGTCHSGDRFFLATDAVAARLLKSVGQGNDPNWEQFETIEPETWRKDLDHLRRVHDMVNDDCTLIAFQIAGGEPTQTDAPGAAVETAPVQPEPVAGATQPATLQAHTLPAETRLTDPSGHTHEVFTVASPTPEPPPPTVEGLALLEHPGEVQENGTVPPHGKGETPSARDGFPESTDPTTV